MNGDYLKSFDQIRKRSKKEEYWAHNISSISFPSIFFRDDWINNDYEFRPKKKKRWAHGINQTRNMSNTYCFPIYLMETLKKDPNLNSLFLSNYWGGEYIKKPQTQIMFLSHADVRKKGQKIHPVVLPPKRITGEERNLNSSPHLSKFLTKTSDRGGKQRKNPSHKHTGPRPHHALGHWYGGALTSMMVCPRKSSLSRVSFCLSLDLMSLSSSHTLTLMRSLELWHSLRGKEESVNVVSKYDVFKQLVGMWN